MSGGLLGFLAASLLLVAGDQDRLLPEADRDVLARRFAEHGHVVITYPDTQHGFLSPARAAHNAESAARSWQRINPKR